MKKVLLSSAVIIACFALTSCSNANGQTGRKSGLWQGKECAVVLTYDDALEDHLTNVIPALDALGLKATFNLCAISMYDMRDYIDDWRAAAANGHELGNHTMFHPCIGDVSNSGWINEQNDNDLKLYSLGRITKEIQGQNVLLKAIDGRDERTFAFPCGQRTAANGENYWYSVGYEFVGARGTRQGMVTIDEIDFNDVPCFDIQMQQAEYMIGLIEEAAQKRALVVFMFHSVGGTHNQNASVYEHGRLIRYLKENESRIWTTTFIDAIKNAKANK